MYICDERSGCVAVYQEPHRNCLSMPMSAFVFYTHGKYAYTKDGRYWTVPVWRIKEAQIVCSMLNSRHRVISVAGQIYAKVHMIIT